MQLVFAIGFPWWLGYLSVRLLVGSNTSEKILLAIGYGYFIGCLFVFSICWAASLFQCLNILYVLVLLLMINIVLTLYLYRKNGHANTAIYEQISRLTKNRTNSTKVILIMGLIWLTVRLMSLGAEVILQPLYPWDAYTSWIPKARLWFLSNEIVPMIDNWTWMGGYDIFKGIYTHSSAGERDYLSYITLWHSLAVGQWDESLSQLPWLLAIVAFMCAVTGQLIEASLPRNLIMCVVLFYLSIPILNSHIALSGYADLWVGIFVALAIASLYLWNRQMKHWQLFLAIAMILSCYLVKSQSGAVWACLLLVVMVVSYLGVDISKIYLIFFSSIMLCLMLVIIGVDIGDPAGVQLVINTDLLKIPYLFNSETPGIDEMVGRMMVIIKHMFWYNNWGLFWYLFFILTIVNIKNMSTTIPSSIIFFLISSFMIIVVYILMVNYTSVSIVTVVNRGLLHVVPAYLFIVTMLALPDTAD